MYQWGRAKDGHESRTSDTTLTLATSITPVNDKFILSDIIGSPYDWASVDSNGRLRSTAWVDGGANDICPTGFSVPTEAVLMADTINATTTEITSAATAFSSFLKLPVAGERLRTTGNSKSTDMVGALWSRSTSGSRSRYLAFNSSNGAWRGNSHRADGLSVRCIQD
jgi:uncharacterized protein (TIGR02145 family)